MQQRTLSPSSWLMIPGPAEVTELRKNKPVESLWMAPFAELVRRVSSWIQVHTEEGMAYAAFTLLVFSLGEGRAKTRAAPAARIKNTDEKVNLTMIRRRDCLGVREEKGWIFLI